MLESTVENTRAEQYWALGESWIQAITDGDCDRLEALCHSDAAGRLLSPKRYIEYDNAPALVAKVRQWFGDCTRFTVEHSRIDTVGERLSLFYRFQLFENGGWFVVEQQIYATLRADRIAELHLLCSGFHPISSPGGETADGSPTADDLLVMQTGADGGGSTCALLTPAIKARLRELHPGQILEVRVDDPTARGDVEAWCRLTGHTLLKITEHPGPELRFYLRKKPA